MSVYPPDKRFMIFSFSDYYPSGGISDCPASFDTLDEAINAVEKGTISLSLDITYIYDRIEGVPVWDLINKK